MQPLENPASLVELEANESYLKEKTDNLGRALDLLESQIKPILSEHSRSIAKYHNLLDALAGELLEASTELEIAQSDVRKERWLNA